ncbi:hypothetical protein L686_17590 [Stutzerimonas stutzeri MF28]|nr:hypothetical protein L686_17590 [Stutzerimonas stutzeri MF28]
MNMAVGCIGVLANPRSGRNSGFASSLAHTASGIQMNQQIEGTP